MTEIESHALYTPTIKRAHHTTIYRDIPLATRTAGTAGKRLRSSLSALALQDDRADDGILVALGALTLPAVAYSFAQLWSLLAGGSLQHAIRAFLP